MYTVVLMAALTTTSSAPDFGHRCNGCSGCHGWGGGGGLFHRGGHGCHGCSGYGCNGCSGYGCNGCSGCYGGYGCAGCYGGYGGGWGAYAAWGGGHYGSFYCSGCYGCYGGYSCYGMPGPGGATYVSPGLTWPNRPYNAPPVEETPLPKKKGEQARAKVRIEIPADAKLYVDGILMKTTSDVRLFQTPDLTSGMTYVYELRAELVRNNQTFTESQRLVVRPGEQFSASFAGLEEKAAAAAAASPSTAQR